MDSGMCTTTSVYANKNKKKTIVSETEKRGSEINGR